MGQTNTQGDHDPALRTPHSTREQTRALVVSSACGAADLSDPSGAEAYPYQLACRAFTPLLARWGSTTLVTRPESRLDYALWRARQQNREPLHLSFLPLHSTYLSPRAPNLAFAFCEFPDVPHTDLGCNPRNNYVGIANRLALLLTASAFSRASFLRAGVKTPIQVVPAPAASAYFDIPAWEPRQRSFLECPCYVFPRPQGPPHPPTNPWMPQKRTGRGLRGGARQFYKNYLRPRLHTRLDRYLSLARRLVTTACGFTEETARITYPVSPRLELSGVVYTTILNPLDPRNHWQDLLSAYLLALGGRENAQLVIKVVARPKQVVKAVNNILRYYKKLGLRHRSRLAIVTSDLADAQMVELARASTYYVQATRAEGLGLPLQDFLAAGRPGISPAHTAMADYFRDELGFVVASHPEPASWPRDPDGRHTTTWHRLVWQSLHDHMQTSYAIAEQNRAKYLALACQARERIKSFAGAESVWPRLAAALNSASEAAERQQAASIGGPSGVVLKAS